MNTTTFRVGQTVQYLSYGELQTAIITRISASGEILFLDNGKWMHAISCARIGA